MPIIQIIVVLVVVGVILWLLTFLPIDGKIKQIINGLVIIVVILWLLGFFWPDLWSYHVGHH